MEGDFHQFWVILGDFGRFWWVSPDRPWSHPGHRHPTKRLGQSAVRVRGAFGSLRQVLPAMSRTYPDLQKVCKNALRNTFFAYLRNILEYGRMASLAPKKRCEKVAKRRVFWHLSFLCSAEHFWFNKKYRVFRKISHFVQKKQWKKKVEKWG